MSKLELSGDDIERGASIVLGNFDGVHRGHQSIISNVLDHDHWAVISFSPYPRRFFDPNSPRFELMNPSVQQNTVHAMGGKLGTIRFDAATSQLEPAAFLDTLNRKIAPSTIAIGEDFKFGKDRAGDADFLAEWGAENKVPIVVAPLLFDHNVKVSSTEIRNALIAGRLHDANAMLGRPHIMNGIVSKGDQRGRDLGFPTANLYLDDVLLPKFGIYATRLTIHDGPQKGVYMGASSLGIRPSFGINKPNFETYILDFNADIYDREISVELIDYIRPEEKFDDVDALIFQMTRDVDTIRQTLDAKMSHA